MGNKNGGSYNLSVWREIRMIGQKLIPPTEPLRVSHREELATYDGKSKDPG